MTAIARNPHQSSAEAQKSMKYRPILFNGAMVRALLDGSKKQTRRAVKPQFAHDAIPCEMGATNERGHQITGHSGMWWCEADGNHEEAVRCPYGQPGDRLWVRETWQLAGGGTGYWYAATDSKADDGNSPVSRWRPSIHMPRDASRITLEVTGVRVERLQDISCYDALAEGIPRTRDGFGMPDGSHFHCDDPRQSYYSLWEAINGPGSVEANPWVWVVEFQRVKGLAE